MKTIKNLFLAGVSLLAFNTWIACNSNNTTKDNTANDNGTKKEADQHNDAKFDNKSEKDADFVAEAANISLIEMNLGQLAASNAVNADTKDFGNMMNKDHKKAYDDLAALAAKKAISVPSALNESDRKDYNDMSQKRGNDFDKDYIDKMVNGHKDAIEKFEKESKNAADPDIQVWATNMLPTLRAHLDHAMNIQEKLKNQSASK